MQEQARWHVQQGRLSHAYTGLLRENMVSADSKRLALHALAKLPGWPADLRLEIREGHIEGTLLEGIGSERATGRKYLVKKGPLYQAFNEQGEALNSLPRQGDNFYPSLMHALPDEARNALGFPHTGQSLDLRRAIIDYALTHRSEMAGLLKQASATAGNIKPPVRIKEGRIGYYASGGGPGMDASLITRVQDVYPGLTERQANGYLLKLRRAGQSDAQIYGHLQARLREWQTLESTLDQWLQPSESGVDNSLFGGRTLVDNIKAAWRNAPLVEEDPRLGRLEIAHFGRLPPITADFSHVHDLTLLSPFPEALLRQFPNVEKLRLIATSAESAGVFEVLRGMQRLTHLNITAPHSPALLSNLSSLIHLEDLTLLGADYSSNSLGEPYDFSSFKQLRRLELVDLQMKQWPAGLLELPRLERLNLRRTSIDKLPDGLERNERLLAGLSLDWSYFPREVFKPIYEHISAQPGHLIDLTEMVNDYCRGELRRLGNAGSEVLINKFIAQWEGAQARFEAIEALSSQHLELERQLEEWIRTRSELCSRWS
jgi:hypothetical protein